MLRVAGFSLLEMIAALTVLALGTVVLFSWLGQTLGHLNRFQNQEQESLARLQAVEFLSNVNPSQRPGGRQEFERFAIEWKSRPAREMRDTVSNAHGLGLYQVQLYDVEVAGKDLGGQPWFQFNLKLVGYTQPRRQSKELPF